MNPLKKFWEKRKANIKFKRAGPGHRLNESGHSSKDIASDFSRSQNDAQANAAEAALKRITNEKSKEKSLNLKLSSYKSYPSDFIQSEKEKILEEMKQEEALKENKSGFKDNEDNKHTFNCPSLGIEEHFTLSELKIKIEEKIKSDFVEDPAIMNALLIRNCNEDSKVNNCISTLELILSNLKTNDPEKFEKFRRIRKSKIQAKILSINGGVGFLESVGFELSNDNIWYIFPEMSDIEEKMDYFLDVLKSSEKCQIIVNRNKKILNLEDIPPSERDYHESFYNLTTSEVAREQQALTQARERNEMLMTKAMRKKLEPAKILSKYTRLRIEVLSMPHFIEATFKTDETIADLIKWLNDNDCIIDFDKYNLVCGPDLVKIQDFDKSFQQLELFPTATIRWKIKE